MKKCTAICCFLAVLCIPLGMALANPVQVIQSIQSAIDNADEAAFVKAVNMESLIGQCVDVFMEDAQKIDQQTLPPALALMLSTVNMNSFARQTLRSTLMQEGAAFVRFGVSSGVFAGKVKNTGGITGLLSSLFANISTGRKEIMFIGSPVASQGAVFVPFTIKDHGNGNSYPVEAWLRQENGQWRVIGLRNVRQLMRIFRGESKAPIHG